jgi:predicted DNA-binding ribbon-helix-helix protein
VSRPRKHSFSIKGHRTSISLEAEFWDALREIAAERRTSLGSIVGEIDAARTGDAGLSTAVRLYVLAYFRGRSAAAPEA